MPALFDLGDRSVAVAIGARGGRGSRHNELARISSGIRCLIDLAIGQAEYVTDEMSRGEV